jgi:hypothetical protein
VVVILFWFALIVLSLFSLLRIFRGSASGYGYGQLSVLPESWKRWILDEKPKL